MLDEIRMKLELEIEALTHELNVVLPERISKAVELGDLKENSEYKSAVERQQFAQARIGHLGHRAHELSKIDVTALPADRVGFGSKVKVHELEMDEVLEFTLVAADFMDLEGGHISLDSPIGRGLRGARVDDEVAITLPGGERRYRVIELTTLADQLGES
jgi:transcription elongation factor GreA